jgi:hypothetical protein
LLNHAIAAEEWGLYEGMMFDCNEEDDFLRELFVYMESHKKKEWIAAPRYRMEYRNTCCKRALVSFWGNAFEILWSMKHELAELPHAFECQRIIAVTVIFGYGSKAAITASISHNTCCATLQGCFYIKIKDWFTRCSNTQECFHVLNTIGSNFEMLNKTSQQYDECREYVIYLSRQLQREDDPVRLSHLQRKIRLMKNDTQAMQCLRFSLSQPNPAHHARLRETHIPQ